MILGTHIEQAGSLCNKDHLRFDFTHFKAVTKEELEQVENIVNEKIAEALEVNTQVMTIDEARKTGAMALFGEKYGETVRVVNMSEFSKEFCGGTHVKNTADIRLFKIVSENGVAAGVRRIEALTGDAVIKYFANLEKRVNEAAAVAKTDSSNLVDKIQSLLNEIKELKSENESLKAKMAQNSLGDAASEFTEVNGFNVLTKEVAGVDMNGLRNLSDDLKAKKENCVIVLASANDGKVNLLVVADETAVKNGAHAGNIIKAIAPTVGGGGGGRPNMAQAGGKNPAGIADALAQVATLL